MFTLERTRNRCDVTRIAIDMSRVTVFLLIGLLQLSIASMSTQQPRQDIIKRLFDETADFQNQKDIPYQKFKSWMKQSGIYQSDVKLNFHGKLAMMEARRLGNIYDNNMFVTAWVTSSLLEATRYQKYSKPSEEQIELALDAIYAHRDMNKAYNTSTYAFWQQRYNQTVKFWSSQPTNLLSFMALTEDLPVDLIVDIIADLGMKELAEQIKDLLGMESTLKASFHIPPDFDDTFVNLGLGSLLFQLKSHYPASWNKWSKHNTNVTSAYDALSKYAYRPFSPDNNTNSIDPRSYYVIRQFLDQAFGAGQDIALVTTWIQNIAEVRTQFYEGVAMPFQVNNIDITVAANTIFGVTSSILAGLVKADVLNDKDIGQIYLNTSSLIGHELNTNLTDRPDIALLYYPSQMEFDWFVSRTVDQMETFILTQPLPHPIMASVYTILTNATRGAMTKSILSKAKTDEKTKVVFFDDFLGDADISLENRTVNRAEDRMFTSAMAANALLYTWSTCDLNAGKCHWRKDCPDKVRSTIDGCIQWLTEHALDGQYKPWNAFFSGSAKTFESLPFWYPGNRLEFINGTTITNWKHLPDSVDYLYALRGYVKKADYDVMLQKPHFGENTPRDFHGFNEGSGGFPMWSADAYTYSVTSLALSRYDNIMNNL